MNCYCCRALSAFLAYSLCVSCASADVITLESVRDNTLYETTDGSLSNGAGDHFFAGATGLFSLRRGLVLFDVSGIAPGGTINSVTLTLNMSQTVAGATDVSLHRVLADWGEAGSDAPLEEGAGGPSQNGDATWIHTFFPDDFWANAGGDFIGSASATTSVGGVGSYSWSSPQLVADVQAWVDGTASNFGWIVIGNESAPTTAKRFDTRENPTAANRPVVQIDFIPIPEPGTGSLLVLLAAGGAMFRRRQR